MPPTAIELSASSVEEQARPECDRRADGVDPDDDTHTFELIDDVAGCSRSRAQPEVEADAILNHEAAAEATIMVRATDGEAPASTRFDIEIQTCARSSTRSTTGWLPAPGDRRRGAGRDDPVRDRAGPVDRRRLALTLTKAVISAQGVKGAIRTRRSDPPVVTNIASTDPRLAVAPRDEQHRGRRHHEALLQLDLARGTHADAARSSQIPLHGARRRGDRERRALSRRRGDNMSPRPTLTADAPTPS